MNDRRHFESLKLLNKGDVLLVQGQIKHFIKYPCKVWNTNKEILMDLANKTYDKTTERHYVKFKQNHEDYVL